MVPGIEVTVVLGHLFAMPRAEADRPLGGNA